MQSFCQFVEGFFGYNSLDNYNSSYSFFSKGFSYDRPKSVDEISPMTTKPSDMPSLMAV